MLGGAAAFALGGAPGRGGELSERWVSDTARHNQVNHHAVGVGPRGDVVVAPVTAVPGTEEIGAASCALVRLAPADGAVEWRAPVRSANCSTHALTRPEIADVDGDGGLEVVAGTAERAVVALDAATGEREWTTRVDPGGNHPMMAAPVVADLDADGTPELVAASAQGTVAVLDPARGTELAAYERDVPVWTYPTLADLDGDGDREILVRYADGRVAALDYE